MTLHIQNADKRLLDVIKALSKNNDEPYIIKQEKSAKEKFYEAVKREIEEAERDYLAGKIRSYTPKEAMEEMDRWSKDGM